jgi:hypothetical protein
MKNNDYEITWEDADDMEFKKKARYKCLYAKNMSSTVILFKMTKVSEEQADFQ